MNPAIPHGAHQPRKEGDELLDWAIEDLFEAARMYALAGDRDKARSIAAHADALFALRWEVVS
jgi:hypothetical protein